jgi:gamma-glutamyltranspeptidase / glutathione hydrolase
MAKARGVVAAGHPASARAAAAVLQEGGNAFDAVVAAHFAACVAEPVLSSLAGGGFLLAHPIRGKPVVYDFFVQTPRRKRAREEIRFYPILADFGTVQQEFHIGLGAAATPGCVRGLFEIQRELCKLPMVRLVEPAIELAREGIELNDFQAYIFNIVRPIYLATPEASRVFADPADPLRTAGAGQRLRQPEQADFLHALAREGEGLFYRGEVARSIGRLCEAQGGHLTVADLEGYRAVKRSPLSFRYRDACVHTNPPPSSGGILIAFALDLLAQVPLGEHGFGTTEHLRLLTAVMDLTNRVRDIHEDVAQFLDPALLGRYREEVLGRAQSLRGTTHVGVIDRDGNAASMTVSNGEGCGHLIPGTGVMLNNMLGEEDINRGGFGCWTPNQRMTSMMAPSVALRADGRRIALGSGGSNRIRSAILQVLVNLIDFEMTPEEAVCAPRVHVTGRHLSAEGGFDPLHLAGLLADYPEHTVWDAQNLFFGGAHTVMTDGRGYAGAGDPRRGGTSALVG